MVSCLAGLTAIWGVGHQEEPSSLLVRLLGRLPSPLCISPSVPPALTSWGGSWTTIRPKCQGTRPPAGILVAAGCICLLFVCFLLPTQALFPPPPHSSPSGVLAEHLSDESEALGEKQMAALLSLSPKESC